MRGLGPGVVDGLVGDFHLCARPERFSCVRIAVELGEMAARNIDSNSVASLKGVAGSHQVDLESVDFPGLEWLGLGDTLAVARSHNPFGHVEGSLIGIDVDELGYEIGVYCVRCGKEDDLHRTCDLDLFIQEIG